MKSIMGKKTARGGTYVEACPGDALSKGVSCLKLI